MKYTVKLEDIIKKHSFIYEVNDEIYHIGQLVFKKCNNPIALQYFDKYQSLIDRVGREKLINNQLDESEVEELVYYFKKVKIYSESRSVDETDINSNNKILDFIFSLNEDSKNKLLIQLENFVYSFQYYNK